MLPQATFWSRFHHIIFIFLDAVNMVPIVVFPYLDCICVEVKVLERPMIKRVDQGEILLFWHATIVYDISEARSSSFSLMIFI